MTDAPAPSLDDIDRHAREAWAELAQEFRDLAGDVLIRVEDFASEEILADMGIDDPFELTGLYWASISRSDPSWIRRQANQWCFYSAAPSSMSGSSAAMLACASFVSHVLVHEIGHHFGLSDEHMDKLLEDAD